MRKLIAFSLVSVLLAGSAMASGFQVTAQSARSLGMGLATTGVADDASAVHFNPGGLAFQTTGLVAGALVATNTEGRYTGPSGLGEDQVSALNLVPELYATKQFGIVHFGLGVNTPFGLPIRWENRDTFSGRHVSYLANIRTLNVNPTVAAQITPNLGVAAGADWVHSKIQLERRRAVSGFDVADAKLKSDISDADGWGWNAGVLWRSGPWRAGASYRSEVEIEHEPTLAVTQILTGIAPIDAAVAATIPGAPLDAEVPIELPSSLNLGLAWVSPGGTTVAVEADRTDWSSFSQLIVNVPAQPAFNITRNTGWSDAWAYRVGLEVPCLGLQCRAGVYRDETPQPLADVGPVLPDADRTGYTLGLGIPIGGGWKIDVGYVLVRFDDRTTTIGTTDHLAGLWETTGQELAINLRLN
ncbi:MAG TPA: outer membrane protein transport protein [Thermoanaerobaculia bacterium]|nr:outer membrane protein transport protein [Thermoanaerobaculia bacterium]